MGTTLTAAFLAWDRIAPKPVQLAGYVTTTSHRDGVLMSLFLDRQDQDTLMITKITASPCFDLAFTDTRSPAAAKKKPLVAAWFKSVPIQVKVERDHSPSRPVLEMLIRERPAEMRRMPIFLARMDVRASGVLPYRSNRRFTVKVTPANETLITAVRRQQNLRLDSTRQPDAR